MNNPINDGGPAFPHPELTQDIENGCKTWECATGLSIRDYFAAKALVGVLSSLTPEDRAEMAQHPCDEMNELVAGGCYHVADAMLKQREKKQ